jgi:hypothetical protein
VIEPEPVLSFSVPTDLPQQDFSYLVLQASDQQITGVATYPHEMPELPEDQYALATEAQLLAVGQPGIHYLEPDGTIRTVPLPPPPVVYAGTKSVSSQVRTTDDVPLEVFRFSTSPRHVYRATFSMTAIEATSGVTKDNEVRMTFKATASTLSQIGTTAVLYNVIDTGAATWAIQASVQFPDLVISVRGAAGRVVDWLLTGDIGAYAPEGLET